MRFFENPLSYHVTCPYTKALKTHFNLNCNHRLSSYREVNNSVSVIKTSQLILYREIIAVCSQIHTKHINTLCGQNVELYIKTQSVTRSKHSVSVIKTSQLMLYWEIIAFCSQIHTKHINTLCGQNVELYMNTQSVWHRKHSISVTKTYRSILRKGIISLPFLLICENTCLNYVCETHISLIWTFPSRSVSQSLTNTFQTNTTHHLHTFVFYFLLHVRPYILSIIR